MFKKEKCGAKSRTLAPNRGARAANAYQAGEIHGRSTLNPATLSGSWTSDLGTPGCWWMRAKLSPTHTCSSGPALQPDPQGLCACSTGGPWVRRVPGALQPWHLWFGSRHLPPPLTGVGLRDDTVPGLTWQCVLFLSPSLSLSLSFLHMSLISRNVFPIASVNKSLNTTAIVFQRTHDN